MCWVSLILPPYRRRLSCRGLLLVKRQEANGCTARRELVSGGSRDGPRATRNWRKRLMALPFLCSGVVGMPRFRFVVMGALWMTTFFLFLDRVNISLAAPYMMDELGLSGVQMGLVLSTYYWGYIAGQLGGGIAADRWSIR